MNLQELKKKYDSVPQSLKILKRWVCFKLVSEPTEQDPNHKRKLPKAPFINKDVNARSDDPTTWGYFEDALKTMLNMKYDGIGLEFGMENDDPHIFGVDLDFHPEKGNEVTIQRFQETLNDFDKTLNTYVEYSPSGKGYHFFCYGTIPEGRRRNEDKAKVYGSVEIYPYKRFFTVTGKSYGTPKTIADRTNEIIPLWKKYVDDTEERLKAAEENQRKQQEWANSHKEGDMVIAVLNDDELLRRALASSIGDRFRRLMAGDMSMCNDDHSKADMALCNYLAFFTNRNIDQMDRIFRSSMLMRDKWDSPRGNTTYGRMTLELAIEGCKSEFRIPVQKPTMIPTSKKEDRQLGEEEHPLENNGETHIEPVMNIEKTPEGKIKLIFKPDKFKIGDRYELTDTGNARRFYDVFGREFKYNCTDKCFMFWTGKTWIYDTKCYIREYANEFIRLLKIELEEFKKQCDAEDDETKAKVLKSKYEAYSKNWNRLANKAGKDAMISELSSFKELTLEAKDFNSDPYLLNTESGVVNLKTGELMDFRKELLMNTNTNIEVSFEKAEVWENFLRGIFSRNNPQETEDIIESFQRCIGYTLTGKTNEEVMFIMYGEGSNGKSVLSGVLRNVMGDYYGSIDSSQLMVNRNQSTSVQYSLAELQQTRFLSTTETDKGERFSEKTIKQLTGGEDAISAQKKYGKPFSFLPKFKIWMMTNPKPRIIGTEFAIWRRMFLFPFLHKFTDEEKDIHMSEKLRAEYPKILGWCIQGCLKYLSDTDGGFKQPDCLKKEIKEYKDENDVISEFLKSECDTTKPTVVTSKDKLFNAYKRWCDNNNDFCMRERQFRDELKAKGFECVKDNKGWYYEGIKLFSEGGVLNPNPSPTPQYYQSSYKKKIDPNDWDD